MFKFSKKDYIKELVKEQKARKRIWKQVPGTDGRFHDMDRQRRFDVLEELLSVLEFSGDNAFEELKAQAESNKRVVQISMFS